MGFLPIGYSLAEASVSAGAEHASTDEHAILQDRSAMLKDELPILRDRSAMLNHAQADRPTLGLFSPSRDNSMGNVTVLF